MFAQAATYNVNGRVPPPDLDISGWLVVDPLPEIVAVGFQEIVPLSASNVVMGADTPPNSTRRFYPAVSARCNV
jgi:hypothetical protein